MERERIFKYCEGELSNDELQEFLQWVKSSERNKRLFAEIQNFYLQNQLERAPKLSSHEQEAILQEIYYKLGWVYKRELHSLTLLNSIKFYLVMALIGALYFGVLYIDSTIKERRAKSFLTHNSAIVDSRATITFSDGKTVSLGEREKKEKASQFSVDDDGESAVIKLIEKTEVNPTHRKRTNKPDVELDATGGEPEIRRVNSISTNEGGFYNITLPDGSRVWINSQSTLSFDDNFYKDERRVALSGEAFFYVTKDAEKPFIVEAEGNFITVLGTSFNLKAYSEDSSLKLSLAEGSLLFKVGGTNRTYKLKPLKEIEYNYSSSRVVERDYDPYIQEALQNGYFIFKDETIDDVVTKISRWYNLPIRIENEKYSSKRFNAKLSRDGSVLPLMERLQLSYKFKISMQSDTLVIK